jgi:ESS family glutamate:Na+ symporter
MKVPVGEALTLATAIATIAFGMVLNRALPLLERLSIPPAVTGGIVVAIALEIARRVWGYDVVFGTDLRALLLLVFFASLGLAARFSLLRSGGWAVGVICLAIVATIVAQNAVGIAVARAFDVPAALGLFMGSVAYLGGHGTTAAWAQSAEAANLPAAFEIGIASATLGLIAGGLVGGPVASFLDRKYAAAQPAAAPQPGLPPPIQAAPIVAPESSDRWLLSLLVLAVCLFGGDLLGRVAKAVNFELPAFLTALLAGVVVTNVADALRRPVDFARADLIGTLALRIFLAMSMVSLSFATLGAYIGPLAAALAAQVAVTVLIAVLLVYRAVGGGHEGAVGAGGYLGFALGAMPVGIATMKRIVQRAGPAPRAYVVVTLAAALFQDTANALLVRLFFSLTGTP